MKFTTKKFAAFCCAVALTSVVGCASTATKVDDAVITTKVKSAILGEPALKSLEINVETFKGIVQLSGFVSSSAAENKAVEIARSIKGVKSVKDDMQVK
jgi:osmotically-inducible protein OsmY